MVLYDIISTMAISLKVDYICFWYPNGILSTKSSYLFTNMIQPKKVLTFEDAKQRAFQWKKAIEALQNR